MWDDKAAAIVSVAGGSRGMRMQYHLRQIGVHLNLHFINKPEFFLNASLPPPKFNDAGDLIDGTAEDRLLLVLLALQAFTLRLQANC